MTLHVDRSLKRALGFSILAAVLTKTVTPAIIVAVVAALTVSKVWADTWQAWPDRDGGIVIKKQSQALHGWSGVMPDGRAYKVITEPTRERHEAEVEFIDGTRDWVHREKVCPDAPWLVRHSNTCR